MSTFRGRLFGPGLPGAGTEAEARWSGARLEITAGGRAWSATIDRVEPAGLDGATLKATFREAAEGPDPGSLPGPAPEGDRLFALFVEQPEARTAFAAGAPVELAGPLRRARRLHRSRERRFRLGGALLALLLLLPVLALLAFLARSDAVAGWIVDRIPPEQEARLGEIALAQARSRMKLDDRGPAVDAVRLIGERLTPGTRLRYRWFVADRPEVNAFAAPGGVVVVFRGLVQAAETPEEVAGVLAHEVAHAELRHGLRATVKGMGFRALLALALGDLSGTALEAMVADLTELRFSRDAEREADAEGLRRLAAARIDPRGMVRFFERVRDEAGAAVPALLSTHPAPAERLEALRRETAALRIDATPLPLDWAAVKRGS
jgi:Zn-dependent protease with chaperone function